MNLVLYFCSSFFGLFGNPFWKCMSGNAQFGILVHSFTLHSLVQKGAPIPFIYLRIFVSLQKLYPHHRFLELHWYASIILISVMTSAFYKIVHIFKINRMLSNWGSNECIWIRCGLVRYVKSRTHAKQPQLITKHHVSIHLFVL